MEAAFQILKRKVWNKDGKKKSERKLTANTERRWKHSKGEKKVFLIGQHKTKCFPVKAIALSNPLAES